MIEEGTKAPAFSLEGSDGEMHKLSDFEGRKLVIYFYPKDDTPGCTKESVQFSKLYNEFKAQNVEIVGVSKDSVQSHVAFIEKYNLPFTLLSDPDAKVMDEYGAWGEKNMYGKITVGVIRSTVAIDENGKVLRHWKRVPKAEAHPAKVLEWLTSWINRTKER